MDDNNFKKESGDSTDFLSTETEVITVDFQRSNALVGQVLDGRFLIEKDLTEGGADVGGIGLVYLAKDMKMMNREVVVKILKQSALDNPDLSRKFQHEKEALIRLDHPNIVRILDSGTLLDGNPFLVMEYIAGRSLQRVLQENGKLPIDFIAHITESVTDALSAAHAQKILHRDIKPANIMLTQQEAGFDRVRLIDFGIARVENSRLGEATEIPVSIGTVPYMAPEQLEGKLEQTPAIDIYAFAVVIYKMLTGALPFNPQNSVEMILMQQQGVKALPGKLCSDLPLEAEKILLSALEFEAEKRPQNARTFGRNLAKLLRENINYKTNRDTHTPFVDKTGPAILKNENHYPAPTERVIVEKGTDFPNIDTQIQIQRRSNKPMMWVLIGALILTVIAFPIIFSIWKGDNKKVIATTNNSNTGEKTNSSVVEKSSTKIPEAAPDIKLRYFLIVQKMRDNKPFEEPFKSSGQEIFENGYKFKLNFQSDRDGFIYFFNEDTDEQGKIDYNILYPTLKTNNGSAEIKAKQNIETSNNTFSGTRGTEIVWLIWTAAQQSDLEAVRQAAFSRKGVVRDESSVKKLKEFFDKYKDETKDMSKDKENQQTIISGNGAIVVQRIELEHR